MKDVRELADAQGYEVVRFSGVLEEEISALSPEDGSLFLQEFGLEESGIARLAKVTYSALGLITFFTVSADEVRELEHTEGHYCKRSSRQDSYRFGTRFHPCRCSLIPGPYFGRIFEKLQKKKAFFE